MIAELTNHVWQSTIFAVVAGLLAVAFRKNRAQVRYGLWLSASFKFLIPFSLLIGLGKSLWDALAAGKMAPEIAHPAVSHTMVQITQPFPDTLLLVPSAPPATGWIPIAILGVWACGFAAIALMRFRGWLRIRAAVRASKPIDLPATVAVRSSLGLLEPGIVGFLRPILILPEGILKNLTPPQLEAVLAHELSHVRRRDNLTAAIHMIVEAVFWFHPLVWWIGARLVEERERACDEAVLSLGSEPRDYAAAILNVCRLYVESPLVCVSGIGGSDLKRRIVRIMAQRIAEGLTPGRKVLLGAAAAAAIAIPLALGIFGPSKVRAHRTQAGDAPLHTFETGSIKLSKARAPFNIQPPLYVSGDFYAEDRAIGLIQQAYGHNDSPLKPYQVSGGPDWIKSEVFEIEAKVEGSLVEGDWKKLSNDEQRNQVMLMLRSLLADRFKLRVRHETKELPVYVLRMAKNGPKFAEDNTQSKFGRIQGGGRGKMEFISVPISWFAGSLSWRPELGGRIVLDRTGLQGRYSFTFQWPPKNLAARGGQLADSASSSDSSGPALSTALQDQLGLRLESTNAPVDTVVIERIEQPTEN